MTAVAVVAMRRRHLPEVLAIEAQVHSKPWSARLFEDELVRPRRLYVVARAGAQVIGYAGLLMIVDDGHVATVSVRPDWRRRGVAIAMLVAVVRGALELGAHQLTLEVRVSDTGAQALYRRFGFVPAGARKAYYADNGEDALIMWAHDVASNAYAERLAALEATAAYAPAEPSPGAPVSSPSPTPARPSSAAVASPSVPPAAVHPAGAASGARR